MTLRHLKIFITVADLSSMTAAAESLYVSQPTVSQAISELERYYSIKLFDRLSRRLYITVAGKHLLEYARHITALFDEMERVAKSSDGGGVLRIGASMTVGSSLLPSLVNSYSKSHPLVQVRASVKNTSEIEALILKNLIDFAVVEGSVHTPFIISTPFMDDELVLVCGSSHKLYGRKSIRPSELSSLSFIARELGSGTRELFERIMDSLGIEYDISWECNSSEGIKSAVSSGMGVCVISRRLVEKEMASGSMHIVDIEGVNFKRKFSIVRHKNKYVNPAMSDFFEMMLSQSFELPSRKNIHPKR